MRLIDFSELRPKRKPTRKEKGRYRRWIRYLKDSKLDVEEIHSRAASFTHAGKDPKE